MSNSSANIDRLSYLIDAVCSKIASNDELTELDAILHADQASHSYYLDYCQLHVALLLESQAQLAVQKTFEHIGFGFEEATHADSVTVCDSLLSQSRASFPSFDFFGASVYGTVSYFSSGWPVAYLIATVIFGIGALIGTFTYVSQPVEVAHKIPVISRHVINGQQETEFVGRITGMVDCQWADESTAAINGDYVPLDRKYTLSSGLMEITYGTGAKVILQGPVTYEVKSKNGGFLSIGKLTGKVEVKTAKGFSIRTPTATVTDLGTEFGVEVDKRGVTTSHVFRGLVRIQRLADDGKPEGDGQLLRENESARVERSGQGRIVVVPTTQSAGFVRKIPKPKIMTLDLVDVVAGGDGFSGRRGRGIDPTCGRTTDSLSPGYMSGNGKYHRVEGLPFVDGVFIPDVSSDQVQIDSVGHTFGLFGNANNMTANHLWAGGAIPTDPPNFIRTEIAGVDYASPGHGLLFMHANKGITFDLDAIRRANPGGRILRFRATAGNTETVSAKGTTARGDLWVFVDGQPRFKRRYVSSLSGAISINIPIGDNNRFLTLTATDGGHGIEYSWITFGDPRLELRLTTSEDINRDHDSQSP